MERKGIMSSDIQNCNRIPVGKAEDLTNKKFGKLVPLYRVEAPRTSWLCQCDCGKKKIVRASNLKKGTTLSCGCFQKEQASKVNSSNIVPGMRFGRLLVLGKAEKDTKIKDRCIKWSCLCDCGNKVSVTSHNLLSGHTQSCGCLKKERTSQTHGIDLTGQRFGLLVPLELDLLAEKRSWICVCDCGNIKSVPSSWLLDGRAISCGCKHESLGVLKIKELLQNANISFVQEKSFESCINSVTKRKFRFDFYIDNLYLLEYDGEQHFKESSLFGGKEEFEKRKEYDNYKNSWCEENGIPLIRIPYNKISTLDIQDLKLETSHFIVTKGAKR